MTLAPPHLIWSNAFRDSASEALLERAFPNQQFQLASGPDAAIPDEATVLFGHPDPERLVQLNRLRWVQIDSAGYTPYDNEKVRDFLRSRDIQLTNSSAVYAEPCAQQALAFLLMGSRQIGEALNRRGSWDQVELRARSRLLEGDTVLILGFGQIGRRLVELLAPLNVRILAVRRTPGPAADGVQVIAPERLAEFLPQVDHLIDVLPLTPATARFVDQALLDKLKRGACFYNIGRGATVDQQALIASLESAKLAACFLDVTDPEPLPADHPLWRAPRCYITPHIAGGFAGEFLRLAEFFIANWRRFEAGEALEGRVI